MEGVRLRGGCCGGVRLGVAGVWREIYLCEGGGCAGVRELEAEVQVCEGEGTEA